MKIIPFWFSSFAARIENLRFKFRYDGSQAWNSQLNGFFTISKRHRYGILLNLLVVCKIQPLPQIPCEVFNNSRISFAIPGWVIGKQRKQLFVGDKWQSIHNSLGKLGEFFPVKLFLLCKLKSNVLIVDWVLFARQW